MNRITDKVLSVLYKAKMHVFKSLIKDLSRPKTREVLFAELRIREATVLSVVLQQALGW